MQTEANHVVFSGRVQGVGFRYIARQAAERYDLTGWVKNLPDGKVEALFQGSGQRIEACLSDLREHFSGYIRDTKIVAQPPDPRVTDFRITY